jgi:hypothetical protein
MYWSNYGYKLKRVCWSNFGVLRSWYQTAKYGELLYRHIKADIEREN